MANGVQTGAGTEHRTSGSTNYHINPCPRCPPPFQNGRCVNWGVRVRRSRRATTEWGFAHGVFRTTSSARVIFCARMQNVQLSFLNRRSLPNASEPTSVRQIVGGWDSCRQARHPAPDAKGVSVENARPILSFRSRINNWKNGKNTQKSDHVGRSGKNIMITAL